VRKAVIPAAGLGTRFLPATKAQPKEMLPLVDKPAIQYVVEEAVRAGLTDILIVTGRGKSSLEDHFDRSLELEAHLEASGKLDELAEVRAVAELATIHYVRQKVPRGLGHAVAVASEHVGDEPFAVLLGDDVMHPDSRLLEDMLAAHAERGGPVLALKEVDKDDIAAYGCAAVEGRPPVVGVTAIVEKPEPADAPSNLAVIGRYVLTPDIFAALSRIEPGHGGELQLTDAIGQLMGQRPVYGFVFQTGRFDVGNKLDYLRATVELALERADVGPPLREFLTELVRRTEEA